MQQLALLVALVPALSFAGSVSAYSGCKRLGSEREACMKCLASGAFYQPGQGCGMVEGMHRSKSVGTDKPPPRPTAMPKAGKDYVTIPAGSFDIGARETDPDKDADTEVFDARVTLTRAFLMKTTEVTQGEYYFVMGKVTACWEKRYPLEAPANCVSWNDAVLYLNELSKKEKLEPCYEIKEGLAKWKGYDCTGYRLPTEAEWEWAARGGTEEPRYGELKEVAWFYENSGDGELHPVGKKKPNAYGLFDMLGSVWEWSFDGWEYKPYVGEVTDPMVGGDTLKTTFEDRIRRGGAFSEQGYSVRAQIRSRYGANSGGKDQGFRPVRTLKEKKKD